MKRALNISFLLGAYKGKFDSILRKLEQDFSLGSDLYPNRRNETLKILNKHLRSNRQNINGSRGDRTGRGAGRGGDPGRRTGGRGRGNSVQNRDTGRENMYLSYKMPTNLPLPVQNARHVVKLVILVGTVLILLPKTTYNF